MKKSLARDFDPVDDLDRAQRYGVVNPFRLAEIDLVVQERDAQVPAPGTAG